MPRIATAALTTSPGSTASRPRSEPPPDTGTKEAKLFTADRRLAGRKALCAVSTSTCWPAIARTCCWPSLRPRNCVSMAPLTRMAGSVLGLS